MSERTAPTLDDVARAAGVSRATASRVINGVVPVSPPAAEAAFAPAPDAPPPPPPARLPEVAWLYPAPPL